MKKFASAIFTLGTHYEMLAEAVPVALLYGDIASGKSRILDAWEPLTLNHSVKSCPDG